MNKSDEDTFFMQMNKPNFGIFDKMFVGLIILLLGSIFGFAIYVLISTIGIGYALLLIIGFPALAYLIGSILLKWE